MHRLIWIAGIFTGAAFSQSAERIFDPTDVVPAPLFASGISLIGDEFAYVAVSGDVEPSPAHEIFALSPGNPPQPTGPVSWFYPNLVETWFEEDPDSGSFEFRMFVGAFSGLFLYSVTFDGTDVTDDLENILPNMDFPPSPETREPIAMNGNSDGTVAVAFTDPYPDTVFRISRDGAEIEAVLDETGDGTNGFVGARGLFITDEGVIYATGRLSENVFRVDPNGDITMVADGSGVTGWNAPDKVTVDSIGNVYVGSGSIDSIWRIKPTGETNRVLSKGTNGDVRLDVLSDDSVIVSNVDEGVYRLDLSAEPDSGGDIAGVTVSVIRSVDADGLGNDLSAYDLAVNDQDDIYVTGGDNADVFLLRQQVFATGFEPAGE